MRRPARLLSFLAPLALAAALGAGCREPALSEPEDVIGRMLERVRADYADVHAFTVLADSAVVHFERTSPATDSLPVFRTRAAANDEAQTPIPDPYLLPVPGTLAQLRTQGRLVGQDTLGGRTVYVVEAERPREFLGLPPAGSDSGYVARVYVDAETFRVAGLYVQQPPPPNAPNPALGPLVQVVRYEDYRAAGGLTIPHRTRLRREGIRALIPDETRMVMGGTLALQRAQADQLPPALRSQRLREVDRQIALYNDGVQTVTFTVREVRVDTGSPFNDAPAAPPAGAPPPAAP